MRLKGQRAIVTDGASVNGRVICQVFANLGAGTIVADLTKTAQAGGVPRADMLPARRWGEPEEVADACNNPASDLAEYGRGTSLVVDGGSLRN